MTKNKNSKITTKTRTNTQHTTPRRSICSNNKIVKIYKYNKNLVVHVISENIYYGISNQLSFSVVEYEIASTQVKLLSKKQQQEMKTKRNYITLIFDSVIWCYGMCPIFFFFCFTRFWFLFFIFSPFYCCCAFFGTKKSE